MQWRKTGKQGEREGGRTQILLPDLQSRILTLCFILVTLTFTNPYSPSFTDFRWRPQCTVRSFLCLGINATYHLLWPAYYSINTYALSAYDLIPAVQFAFQHLFYLLEVLGYGRPSLHLSEACGIRRYLQLHFLSDILSSSKFGSPSLSLQLFAYTFPVWMTSWYPRWWSWWVEPVM